MKQEILLLLFPLILDPLLARKNMRAQLKFRFSNLTYDGDLPEFTEQSIHRFVSDFSIKINTNVVFAEVEFCAVEFLAYAIHWLNQTRKNPRDFVYTSVESEFSGLVWIKKRNSKWQVGSIHQKYNDDTLFTLGEISEALTDYGDALKQEFEQRYQFNLDKLLEKFAMKMLP